MRNVLNVIADVLTLAAVCVASIGHVLPWFNVFRIPWQFNGPGGAADPAIVQDTEAKLIEFQQTHAAQSGIALGVLAGLIFLSLLIRWGPGLRRLLTICMFVSAFAALLLELLVLTDLPHLDLGRVVSFTSIQSEGFYLAMVPTACAVFFCLVRMLWTMPAVKPPKPATLDVKPPMATPIRESGFTERKI